MADETKEELIWDRRGAERGRGTRSTARLLIFPCNHPASLARKLGNPGSRAQHATLRQSSSPQTRQQVRASHTLRTTLAQVARRSVPNPRGITGDRVAHPGRRGATRVAPSHPDSGGCNHFHWYHAPHFDSIT